MATGIAFTRAQNFPGHSPLPVFINGEMADAVPGRERQEFHLPPGLYSIQFASCWCLSSPYEVEVRPGEMVEVEGGARWHGLFQVIILFAIFVAPGRVLVIRPAPPVNPSSVRRALLEVWEWIAGFIGVVLVGILGCLVLYLLCVILGYS